MIKIFVINLKKDTDKKEYIKNLFQKYNLEFEFIDGIYGKELSDDEVSKFYNKRLAVEKLGRELSKSEIGCGLSHMKIYEKMVNENIQKAIVFEDDIYFDDKFIEFLKNIENILDYVDILLLGHHNAVSRNKPAIYTFFGKYSLSNEFILRCPADIGYGTYGYIINLSGAKKLLKFKNNLYLPIDHYTGNKSYTDVFFLESPIIYIRDDCESEIDKDRLILQKTKNLKAYFNNIFKIYKAKYYTLSFFKRLKGFKCFPR